MSSENRKKVVITGAGGFLGGNLVEALKGSEEYFVYALSSRGAELQRENRSANMQYCHKDAIFDNEGAEILKDAAVVNCAFPRNSTGTAMADGLRYIQRLFCRAQECQAKAIVNISSQSVYSQVREEPATEETPVCLESPYAVGKYATELMLEGMCQGAGIAYTNLRMASLIGPGFDQRIVNRLIEKAINGEPIVVNINKRRFGFLDIIDAVKAIRCLLETDTSRWKKLFNVGNEKSYSMNDIAQTIMDVCKAAGIAAPKIEYRTNQETGSTALKSGALMNITNYSPEISLQESAMRILMEKLQK